MPLIYSLQSGASSGSTDDYSSINDAATIFDVCTTLAALHERESKVTAQLDALLEMQSNLNYELKKLNPMEAELKSQINTTRAIGNNMLSSTVDTTSRVSHRVKALDLEKRKVEDTLGVVEQVAELKACVHGVVGSMGAQDWEAAAGYISRASKVPEEIIKGAFASDIVPSVEIPDPPWVTLNIAKESLCNLFVREFEKSVKEGNKVNVARYFKLFPLIGRTDAGLDVYGRYLCQDVADAARARLRNGSTAVAQKEVGGMFYVNTFTKLLEHTAQIVEGHGELVERHYGAGKMAKIIERLQMEADVQGGIILDLWNDDRGLERRLTDVKSYSFSPLVQSPLPPQRSGTPKMKSWTIAQGANTVRNSEDESIDLKEVDCLLNEIAAMLSKWSFYMRFITGKCRVSPTNMRIWPG
jgi:hypothetical protein